REAQASLAGAVTQARSAYFSSRTVADWASTWPLASTAAAAKYGPFVFTVIAVSKPARRREPAALEQLPAAQATTSHPSHPRHPSLACSPPDLGEFRSAYPGCR